MRSFLRLLLSLLLVVPVVVYLPASAAAAGLDTHGVLVRTIETADWPSPSPDPSAIAYDAVHDRLVTFDGEIDEIPALFDGVNAFETTLTGQPQRTFSTIGWTVEPVGADFHPWTGHLFVSTDEGDRVFEVDPGNDGLVGTTDDARTSWPTAGFGIVDPESIALDAGPTSAGQDDRLFVAGGGAGEVYVVVPGPNGTFEGATGDDTATHWDTAVLGISDIEAIEYDPASDHLYLLGLEATSDIIETTVAGGIVGVIDISPANAMRPGGITLAPGSNDPSETHLYLVDRGVDNAADPGENDGRIYELERANGRAPNLVGNTSFEVDHNLDTRPDQWGTDPSVTRSSAVAKSGTFSARHASSANVGYTLSQDAGPVASGESYAFSAWTNIPPTTDAFTFRHRIQWRDAANSTVRTDIIATYTVATPGWVHAPAELIAPAGAVKARVQANVSSLNAIVYVDDVSLGAAGPANTSPVAEDDPATTTEDAPIAIDVRANDSDPDLDVLDVTSVSNPPRGSAAINANDTITYTPDLNANGPDSFAYTVSDGRGGTDTATVTVTVDAVNDAPFLTTPANRTNTEGASVGLQVAASDLDAGDTLVYDASNLPPGLAIHPQGGLIDGAIELGAAGGSPYTVALTVTDDGSLTAQAVFTWTVHAAQAQPDPPAGLSATVTALAIELDWADSAEPSLAGYNVYRAAASDGPFTRLNGGVLADSAYVDAAAPIDQPSYYRVTVVNNLDQESDPATVVRTREIGFVGARTATIKTGTTISLQKPTGTTTGDALLAALTVSGAVTISPPAGWSQVISTTNGTALMQVVFSRVAGASEPSSYSWTLNTARPTSAVITVYRGTSGVDVSSGQSIVNNKSIRGPSVTTSAADGILVGFFGIAANATVTPDPAMREIADVVITGGGLKAALEVADDLLGTAGATGLRTALATKGGPNIGQVIALRR